MGGLTFLIDDNEVIGIVRGAIQEMDQGSNSMFQTKLVKLASARVQVRFQVSPTTFENITKRFPYDCFLIRGSSLIFSLMVFLSNYKLLN